MLYIRVFFTNSDTELPRLADKQLRPRCKMHKTFTFRNSHADGLRLPKRFPVSVEKSTRKELTERPVPGTHFPDVQWRLVHLNTSLQEAGKFLVRENCKMPSPTSYFAFEESIQISDKKELLCVSRAFRKYCWFYRWRYYCLRSCEFLTFESHGSILIRIRLTPLDVWANQAKENIFFFF